MNKYIIIAATSVLIAMASLTVAYLSGFLKGQQSHRDRQLRKTIEALIKRETINEEISKLDDIGLCLALGGLSDSCTDLLRRLDKTATGE